jgi:ATP-dependent Lhr-like helicase
VIARRVRGYEPGWLDRKISDGEFAFACQPTGGGRAPRVAFFARADVRQPATFQFPPETAEARVVAHLDRRGASFFSDLWHATELDASALADALWDLLGNGVITNDRFEVLRRGRAGIGPGELSTFRAGRASRVTPRFQSGRWSLMGAVPHAADAEWWALKLLDRYGVVGREHVEAERPPVAFRELIDVWKKLELRGEVRRGYFVEGWSGGQFAWPQAVEALRAERPVQSVLVSATDPACAWGSLLPFELPRIASNFMVIEAGRPVLSYESGARRVRVQRADALSRAGEALATLGGVVEIEESDGRPVIGSALDAPLRAAGFEPDGPRLRRSPLRVRPLQG